MRQALGTSSDVCVDPSVCRIISESAKPQIHAEYVTMQAAGSNTGDYHGNFNTRMYLHFADVELIPALIEVCVCVCVN